MSQSVPSANSLRTQPGIFVGRENELREFGQSIRCVLGLEQPPGKHLLYPHVFLISGEGGTGKSALLRQFQVVATEEGLPANRTIVVALRAQRYPDARILAQALAKTIDQPFPKFDQLYQDRLNRRNNLLGEYQNLQREWALWQSLGELSASDRGELLRKHYRISRGGVTRATLLGGKNQSNYLTNRVDLMARQLRNVLQFLGDRGHAPNSFDELLQYQFGDGAGLFQSDVMLGKALAEDIAELTKAAPLVLLLDDYEYADQHDEWLRESLLTQENDRLIVAIAGRNRHEADYRGAFHGPQAQLVRSYNLNARLTTEHMQTYLSKRLGNADALAEVSTISDGLPLALIALGDHLATDDSLAAYQKKPPTDRTPRSIMRGITQRSLHNGFAEKNGDLSQGQRKLRDSQRIRALVLLRRPDPTLACELWGVKPDEGRAIMCDLARRYTFAFAGQEPFELHNLVREVVREELLSRTRYTTEWKADLNGLRRARDTTKDRIAQIERKLHDPIEHYEHAEWRAATLDLLNILLWLGEDDEARRLLLNRWVEARYANAAFADWLLDHAVELAPTVASWRELIQSLQTEDYDVILPLAHLLDPHIQAILWHMRAQLAHVALVSATTLPQLDKQIEMLEQSHTLDKDWTPTVDALCEAYAARGAFRLYEQNAPDNALADFEEILKLRPHDQAALSRRAVAKQRLGDLQGARADFDQVLNTNSDDSATRFNRAMLLADQGELKEALDDFDLVYQQHKDDPILLQRRGETRYRAGDLAGAKADLDRSLQLRVDHPDTLISRARVRAATGGAAGLAAAVADLDRAHTLRPDDPEALSARGEVKSKQPGSLADALTDLNQSLKLRPDHAATLSSRGYVHLLLQIEDAALADFDRSLSLQPDNPTALVNRGSIKYRRADFAGALIDFNRSLKLLSGNINILYRRGLAKYKLNDLKGALADLDPIIVSRPGFYWGHYYHGQINYDLDNLDSALADLDKALGIRPNNAPALYHRGQAKRAKNHLSAALTDFDSALGIQPKYIPALYLRGRTLFDRRRFQEAWEDFDTIIKIEPAHRKAWYWRGRAAFALKRFAEAAADFEGALKSRPIDPKDPDDPDEQEILYWRGLASIRVPRIGALPDLWRTMPRRLARRLGSQW